MIYKNGKWKREQDTRDEIEIARKELGISTERFSEVGKFQWKGILSKIEETFVCQRNSSKRNSIHRCWEGGFSGDDVTGIQFYNYNACEYLHLLVDENEIIWFLPHECSYQREKYWVYQGNVTDIQKILSETCCIDEYYIVSKKFEWLLVENHHGVLVCSGEIMVDRMEKLRRKLSSEIIYKRTTM